MGVPTSEVGYNSATASRRDHESSYERVVALEKKNDLRCCGNKYFRLWCVYCVPCSFSKAQHKLPEGDPIGPKHVGPNVEIF